MTYHDPSTGVVISASLSNNIASVSANDVDLSPIPSVGRSVCLSVRVSGKCTVAKTADSIRMLFGIMSGVGRGVSVLVGDGNRRRGRNSFVG